MTETEWNEFTEKCKSEAPAARERMSVPGFHSMADIITVMVADGKMFETHTGVKP